MTRKGYGAQRKSDHQGLECYDFAPKVKVHHPRTFKQKSKIIRFRCFKKFLKIHTADTVKRELEQAVLKIGLSV